jgi:hypothetical protein
MTRRFDGYMPEWSVTRSVLADLRKSSGWRGASVICALAIDQALMMLLKPLPCDLPLRRSPQHELETIK